MRLGSRPGSVDRRGRAIVLMSGPYDSRGKKSTKSIRTMFLVATAGLQWCSEQRAWYGKRAYQLPKAEFRFTLCFNFQAFRNHRAGLEQYLARPPGRPCRKITVRLGARRHMSRLANAGLSCLPSEQQIVSECLASCVEFLECHADLPGILFLMSDIDRFALNLYGEMTNRTVGYGELYLQ